MNAKALLALIDECGMIELVNRSGRDIDGWIQETILRALRLLAAAEANDGSTPETDDAWTIGYASDNLGEAINQAAAALINREQTSSRIERERNGLAARVAELDPDAERYRWLRVQRHADIAACWYLPVLPQDYPVDTPEQRDIAIDAARSAP